MFYFSCVCSFFHLFDAVWFHNLVPLGPDIPGIALLHNVIHTWHVFIQRVLLPLLLAAATLCVDILLLLQQLLLFVIV